MIERKINSQRCFKIHKSKLDLFLVKLRMNRSEYSYFEAEYIFENKEMYDVVVNEYGSYPYSYYDLCKFVEDISI